MSSRSFGKTMFAVAPLFLIGIATVLQAADRPQWGERYSRNMVSSEKGLPDHFDPKTGKNIKWSAALGSECYCTPVIAAGRVFIGTNNKDLSRPPVAVSAGRAGEKCC